MFTINVRYGSGLSFVVTQPCIVDRLPEAEQHAVQIVNRLFPDREVILVHTGELEYSVYEIDEPIAHVNIGTGE